MAKPSKTKSAALSPLELAFSQGNYLLTRKLARKLLSNNESSESEKNLARSLMEHTNTDPNVLVVGILGVLFALVITFLVIN